MKKFFRSPEISQIKDLKINSLSGHLAEAIFDLPNDQTAVIETELIPNDFEDARKFMKHGREVKLRRYESLEDAVMVKEFPITSRKKAFDSIQNINIAFCGYSFKPFFGLDQRTRRISLVECVNATKIYCYSHQVSDAVGNKPSISVKPYVDAERVGLDGGEVIVEVPSRTEKMDRYEFKVHSVPIVNNDNKWGIPYNIATTHDCKSKRFNIRYKFSEQKESSRHFNFCAHEIAAYMSIVDYFLNKNGNRLLLQMNQFALPTQEAVSFYDKLDFNCLIKNPEDGKLGKLNRVHKEILLWNLVSYLGHDRTFYAKDKIRDYNWMRIDSV